MKAGTFGKADGWQRAKCLRAGYSGDSDLLSLLKVSERS